MRTNYFFKSSNKPLLKDYLLAQIFETLNPRINKTSYKNWKFIGKLNIDSELNKDSSFTILSEEFNSSDKNLIDFFNRSDSPQNNGSITISFAALGAILKSDTFWKTASNINVIIGDDLLLLLKNRENKSSDFLEGELDEFSKLITQTAPLGNFNYYFSVKLENIHWVDDISLLFSELKQNRLVFFPSQSLLSCFSANPKGYVEERFHIAMFFENLSRQKTNSLELRFFYKKIYNLIYSNSSINTTLIKIENWVDLFKIEKDNKAYFNDLWMYGFVDLFTRASYSNVITLIRNSINSRVKKKNNLEFQVQVPKANPSSNIDPRLWKTVLITGWYGTETQGDKAIIGEVLHFIKSASPTCKIILTTLHNGISEQTNLELSDLFGVELIKLDDSNLATKISKTDAVIIGGGPLMESASMKDIGIIFREAHKYSIPRIIFGCGIGPIHSKEVENITKYLLSVCNAGFVRDKESFDFANKLFPDHKLKFACDPAVGFVSRWRKENKVVYSPNGEHTIATLLRANTNEFSPESNTEKLRIANEFLAQKMAVSLDNIADKTGASYELLHMNAPWVGGDDRIYNRILASQLAPATKVNLVREYLTLEEHMKVLSNCNASLAMRYHGHIFCMAMGIPFLSLDYTGKNGKVSSLVNRIGYSKWSIKWDEIDPISMTILYEKLMLDSEEWSAYLISEADKLVLLLHQTYKEVFNYCPEN